MERSDAQLIVASVDDPRAFRELYDRWARVLLAYLYRRVMDPEIAADLLAETFATAFEKRSGFRDRGTPGSRWLYGIAAKQLARYFRRRRVELRAMHRLGLTVPEVDEESARAISKLVDGDDRAARVAQALRLMPSSQRVAVELRVVRELGYGEIAGRLDCSEAAARVRVHRGLARLNRLLEDPR